MKTRYFPLRQVLKPRGWRLIPWALFGNEDDPHPPADYMPTSSPCWRRVCWWGRNPFHNLCFYVAGCCDRDSTSVGLDPGVVFRESGANWCWTFAGPLPRPFFSYRGRKLRGYLGWRPGGALGIKLQRERADRSFPLMP